MVTDTEKLGNHWGSKTYVELKIVHEILMQFRQHLCCQYLNPPAQERFGTLQHWFTNKYCKSWISITSVIWRKFYLTYFFIGIVWFALRSFLEEVRSNDHHDCYSLPLLWFSTSGTLIVYFTLLSKTWMHDFGIKGSSPLNNLIYALNQPAKK